MNKEFIPYQQAMSLEALGFDEPWFGSWVDGTLDLITSDINDYDLKYVEVIKAPTFSQAFRFFREKYHIFSCVMTEYSYGGHISAYHINGKHQSSISKGDFATYEEAELACLNKLIEIVKGGNNG